MIDVCATGRILYERSVQVRSPLSIQGIDEIKEHWTGQVRARGIGWRKAKKRGRRGDSGRLEVRCSWKVRAND